MSSVYRIKVKLKKKKLTPLMETIVSIILDRIDESDISSKKVNKLVDNKRLYKIRILFIFIRF